VNWVPPTEVTLGSADISLIAAAPWSPAAMKTLCPWLAAYWNGGSITFIMNDDATP
jgi:hypothetical protein